MPDHCAECGAATPAGGTCRDHFHALLLLESQIPGGPGSPAHFYAVASYGLQHPDSMNYTADALDGLRAGLADMLDGRATLEGLRRRIRRGADGSTRVTRREGDPIVPWKRGGWTMTVADVLGVEPDAAAYLERVSLWAHSVRVALDADPAR